MSKRILSLALVVMMLVAFIPATLFTASAEGEAYRFKLDFRYVYNVPELGLSYTTTESKSYVNVASAKDYAMTKGMWKYYSSSSLSTGYNGVALGGGLCPQLTYGGKAWVAIKFNVPAAGTYDIALDLMEGRDAGSYYIIPGNTATGSCFSVATGGTEDSIVLVEDSKADTTVTGVSLNAGEYILVQRGLSTQTSWTCPGIAGLTFTASGATEFAPLYYGTIYPTTVEEGSTADISANIYDAFTHAAYEGDVAYAVSDTSVATVDGATVSGVKFGEVDVSAAIDGVLSFITSGSLVVPSDETPYKFTYHFGKFDNVPDLGLALVNQTSDTAYFQAQSIKDYAMTNGAWKYYTSKGISTAYNGMQKGTGIRCYSTGGIGSYLAFKLNVPVSGTFNIKLSTPGTCAQVDCFLIPVGVLDSLSLANAMNSDKAIALATDFATSAASSTTVKGIEITKGEYVFAWRADQSGWSVPYISTLQFTTTASSGDYVPVYFGTVDPIPDALEGDATITPNARIYNANDYTEYTGDYSFTTGNAAVATASGKTVTAIAGSGGETTVGVSIPGALSGVVPTNISVLSSVVPYQFRYSFGKIYEREDLGLKFVYATAASDAAMVNPTSIKDYAMTHGAWKYHSGKDISPNYGGITSGSFYPYLTSTSGYIALELNVPISGTFDINYVANTVSQASKLYLLNPGTTFASKADIIAAVEAGNGIVIDDNYVYTGGGYSKTVPAVEIEAGKYILALVANQEEGWCRFSLGTLTFSTTNPSKEYQPVYFGTVDPMTLEDIGTTKEAKAYVYDSMSIDTVYETDATFEIADSGIASVSDSTVTSVNFGETSISASIAAGAQGIIPAKIKVASSDTPYQFQYHFGKIYNVPELGLEYGMQSGDKGQANVKTITDYAMTHGAWKHYDSPSTVLDSWGGLVIGTSLRAYFTNADSYLALKLNVPVSGTFDVELRFPSAGSAAASYYIIPGDTAVADIKATMKSDKAIVIAEGHSSSGTSVVNVKDVKLTKGEYIFVYSAIENKWTQPNPATLTFSTSHPKGAYEPIYFGTVDSFEGAIGDTTTATVRAYNAMNPDAAAYAGEVTFSVEDPTVASIDGTTVTLLKGGNTKLNASLTGVASGIIPGTLASKVYGYRFKYLFKTNENGVLSFPELDVYAWKNGMEYAYDWRTVNDYAITHGMWKFHTASGVSTYGGITAGYTQITPTANPGTDKNNFYAIKIKVPASGTYDVSYTTYPCGPTYIYLLPGDTPANAATVGNLIAGEDKRVLFDGVSIAEGYTTFTHEDFEIEAGEYVLVFKSSYYGYMRPSEITFVSSDVTNFKPVYVGTVDPIKVGEDETATANARLYDAWTYEAYTGDVTFAVEDAGVASVADKTVTPAGTGTTTISATLPEGTIGTIEKGSISVATQELVDAYAKKAVYGYSKGTTTAKAFIKGVGVTDTITPTATKPKNSNRYNLVAPEVEGYKFLYWVKGAQEAKKILSFDAEYTYDPVTGSNIIIAVYEQAGATEETKAEFYNPNGQLVTTLTANETAPALPTASGKIPLYWKNKYGKKLDAGAAVTLEEGKSEIWVAVYDSTVASVIVTAENATGGGTVEYGSLVTLTANGEGTFKWWEKTDAEGKTEIVGFGSTSYSFYAWDDCTVTAVYGSEAPVYYSNKAMKILVDTFNGNNVMAEFIGFAGTTILEKGIKLGGTDYAMSTNNMQFTLYNNSGAAAKGYAIIEINGRVFRIEDGE